MLCTDKTGTLTVDKVSLVRYLDPWGRESRRLLATAYLNSYYQTGLKNLLDEGVIQVGCLIAQHLGFWGFNFRVCGFNQGSIPEL